MNPFDLGMVEPGGFYALNFSDVVKPEKIVHSSVEMMFYNPCWWLLGDYHPVVKQNKTSGSHYFEGAPSRKLYWHLFDQVILSPPLIPHFVHDDLEIVQVQEIIDELAKKKLARKGALYSDHLPIIFSFNFDL
ncbi:MAG TPA: hypothetical protein VGS79_14415 [Puia sp.]|nr:hypothetical protein [Puia sp.]